MNNEETIASEKFSEASKGRALDIVAGFVGVGRTTLKKAEEIVTAAEEERTRKKKYDNGKCITIFYSKNILTILIRKTIIN